MHDSWTQNTNNTNSVIINGMHHKHGRELRAATMSFPKGWTMAFENRNGINLHIEVWDYARVQNSKPLVFSVFDSNKDAVLISEGDYGVDGEFGESGAVVAKVTYQLNEWLQTEAKPEDD